MQLRWFFVFIVAHPVKRLRNNCVFSSLDITAGLSRFWQAFGTVVDLMEQLPGDRIIHFCWYNKYLQQQEAAREPESNKLQYPCSSPCRMWFHCFTLRDRASADNSCGVFLVLVLDPQPPQSSFFFLLLLKAIWPLIWLKLCWRLSGSVWEPSSHLRSGWQHVQEHDDRPWEPVRHHQVTLLHTLGIEGTEQVLPQSFGRADWPRFIYLFYYYY